MFKILKFKESNEVRHYRSSAEALAADCKFNGIDMEEFDLVEAEAEPVPGWDGRMYLTRQDIPAAPPAVEHADRIAELQMYLNETDWYAARLAEKGIPVPQDVSDKRQEAREEIERLRG